MSKTKQVLALLKDGRTVKEITKIAKVKPSFVYTVRWQSKKTNGASKKTATFKSPRSRLINDLFQMKKAMDEVEKKAAVGEKPTKLFIQPQHKDPAMKLLAELDAAEKKLDLVNKPPHYKTGGVETIDFIEAKDLNYRLGNVVKYVVRCGKKANSDPVQDLEKAAFYLNREIAARKGA